LLGRLQLTKHCYLQCEVIVLPVQLQVNKKLDTSLVKLFMVTIVGRTLYASVHLIETSLVSTSRVN